MIEDIINERKKHLATITEIEMLTRKNVSENTKLRAKTLFEEVLFEDEDFYLSVSYSVAFGARVYFDSKQESKYNTYDVFGSYSFFSSFVEKLYDASELYSLEELSSALKEDYSNLEEVVNAVERLAKRMKSSAYYKLYFEYLGNLVRTALSN